MATQFTAPLHPSPSNMTLVSDDPSWWPLINSNRIASYFAVVASVGVTYDWILTLGQEVELIWRQRWSLMTVLYLSLRYLGILYAVLNILIYIPTISVTDIVSVLHRFLSIPVRSTALPYRDVGRIIYLTMNWESVVVFAIMGVIMIARLRAMYQRSRNLLIFLVIIFLTVNIADGVIVAIAMKRTTEEELILSGTYLCTAEGNILLLVSMYWILAAIWEVLALCLVVWIAVKHFLLMKTHVLYFASFLAISCFELVYLSPTFSADQYSVETQIYQGALQIFVLVQQFVLGPRLVLSVREHQSKLAADSDAGISMTSMVFQDRIHVSTSNGV
ncbi:uncharacterized protein EDB93DRAFT_1245969 [Suillus bovinus]|uniref:uncharacterized protein n=1 Tax=Suillus bovinus TaxID=48563 RepID=UPI001B871050|nr:uncharacterized protein EDB93DRAFT_1245969 [Suillus bovinus]KAG2158736.1 hypothetical protein EDB93DRAFT_1245969 [Suillus bovinus]